MNKVIITHKGVMVNPASAPLLPDEVANSLKKRMADPRKGEAPSGVLGASGTDKPCKETFDAPIVSQYRPSVKEFETVRAQLALRAHTLTAKPHQSGLTLWEVGKWGQVRVFSHWNDVLAFRAQIGV